MLTIALLTDGVIGSTTALLTDGWIGVAVGPSPTPDPPDVVVLTIEEMGVYASSSSTQEFDVIATSTNFSSSAVVIGALIATVEVL